MPSPTFKTYKPAPTAKTATSWSFSRWADWAQCPLMFRCKHLDKLPSGPTNPAMERGRLIAEASEEYLLKRTPKLHNDLRTFRDHYAFYRKQKSLVAESQWGFKADWSPTAWNDWDGCWLRAKVDIGYAFAGDNSFNIRDGKTGKYDDRKREMYMLQLDLYAAAAASVYPEVATITTQLLYTDLGITYPEDEPATYTHAQAVAQQAVWTKRVRPMMTAKTYPARPGYYCSWCPYSKAKGGPCKF